jgi:heptosyltransferase III
MSNLDTRHLLAIRPGALGDTLLALPALALLRHALPQAHVTLVARRDVLPLVHAWGLADAASPYDAPEWSEIFAETLPSDSKIRAGIAGSTAIAWLADADGHIAANLRALGAEEVIIGPGQPCEGSHTHAALQLAATHAALGISVPTDTGALCAVLPPLHLTPLSDIVGASGGRPPSRTVGALPAAPGEVEGPGRCLVALHAGSGSAAKRWPPERFAALAGVLCSLDLRPVLIAGPQDGDITDAILAEAARRGVALTVARDLDILGLARLLAGCAAYVGNDSGVSHLAGLLGLPTLALFGPTDPAIWSPLGPRVRTPRSQSGAMADLPLARVVSALRGLLAAS